MQPSQSTRSSAKVRTRSSRAEHESTAEGLAGIVADYVARVRAPACEHLAFYATQPSLANALEAVASWRGPEGRLEPRQRRLPRKTKVLAAKEILALKVGDAMTFVEIHRRVQEALGALEGLGPLTVYDVSFRIGAVLGLPPQHVYQHAGVRAGLRALGIRSSASTVPVNSFPTEMRRLYAWEIEKLLCLYRDRLRQLRRRNAA